MLSRWVADQNFATCRNISSFNLVITSICILHRCPVSNVKQHSQSQPWIPHTSILHQSLLYSHCTHIIVPLSSSLQPKVFSTIYHTSLSLSSSIIALLCNVVSCKLRPGSISSCTPLFHSVPQFCFLFSDFCVHSPPPLLALSISQSLPTPSYLHFFVIL